MDERDPRTSGSQENRETAPESSKERRKLSGRQHSRAVILGALAAGGVFQLNGWQVQAHGNRSSHSASTVSSVVFTPNDYVLLRQSFTAPNVEDTRRLMEVTEQLRGAQPGAADTAELTATRQELENKLRLRSTTSRSLELLRQGDTAGAIAAIEGEGWTERVLGEYLWALLDTAYLGREGDAFTAGHMKEFSTLSKAAMAYCDRVLAGLPLRNPSSQDIATRDRVAEIYHNIASFTLPDEGVASPEDVRLGREAAQKALDLRRQRGQKPEIMRAYWMVGKHELKAGDTQMARNSFESSLQLANELNDKAGMAWGKTYLAKTLAPNSRQAQRLLSGADRDVETAAAKDVSLQFLRMEKSRNE